nr:Beta-galactosidase C-terminal domain [Pantoea sp. M_5]
MVVQRRTDGEQAFLFVQNFTGQTQQVLLPAGLSDLIDGTPMTGSLMLAAWGCRVLSRPLE